MRSDWKTCALNEIVDFGNGKARPKTQGDIPIYGGNGILGYSGDSNYQDETIIIGRVGAYCGATYYENKPIWVSDNALSAKAKEGFISKYAYYVLKSKNLNQYAQGSSHPLLTQGLLNAIEVCVTTNLETQKKIVSIISALEDKIDLNRQTNQTLEQIAQAIFKSWFVDFDPVKAKMEILAAGGTAEKAELAAMSVISAKSMDELHKLKANNPDQFSELAQTAALFPSAMQDSELGEIPEGWDIYDLASCTKELRRGISPIYTEEEDGVLVLNQKCIRNHTVNFSLGRRNDPSKRKIDGRQIEIGDVLINSTGVGTLGRLSPIRRLNETTVVDSHITVVRANTEMISKSFLAGLMLTNEAYIEASGAGTTGQIELRKQVLEDIKFTKPSNDIDKYFDVIASNLNSQIAELEKQSVSLSATRDTLLPELFSGRI